MRAYAVLFYKFYKSAAALARRHAHFLLLDSQKILRIEKARLVSLDPKGHPLKDMPIPRSMAQGAVASPIAEGVCPLIRREERKDQPCSRPHRLVCLSAERYASRRQLTSLLSLSVTDGKVGSTEFAVGIELALILARRDPDVLFKGADKVRVIIKAAEIGGIGHVAPRGKQLLRLRDPLGHEVF